MTNQQLFQDHFSPLDDRYRKRGWGRITDLALGCRPRDVEEQARDVARWAYERIATLEAVIRQQQACLNLIPEADDCASAIPLVDFITDE